MRVIQNIIILLLCCSRLGSHAQTEQEIRKQAEQLFNSGKYVDATPLYTRLLALQPRDYGYNFRYGACLLFNSSKKQDALKYLNYAIQDPSTQPDIFYFLGRALHLNYQFNEAIDNYTAYRKSGKNSVFLKETERFIEMCKNGKQLLSNITDIIVLDKKEIAADKFFRLYDLKDIGGNILVTIDFQTKLDKKNNHQPIIHFPNQPKAIFYASYGESGTNGKDIYVRTKQRDGAWSDPQLVKGGVNTAFDEDYPYMHPDGKYLYFASKGHNSMGGFDIFRCKYDEYTYEFGPAENLDFAISSPDDDVFFVIDSLNRDAFFASARQSEAGKLTVYKVKVDRVPLQLAVLKGKFISKVDSELSTARIDVISKQTGKKVGTYQTNSEADYMVTLPKAGEYEFIIRVGTRQQEFRSIVTVPQLSAFRPLKQQLVHTEENGTEIVRVVNLFDENVENADDVMAEVIRVRSTLDVNAQDFDLATYEATQEYRKALSELGLSQMNNNEVIDVLNQELLQLDKQTSFNTDLQQQVTSLIIVNAEEIKELDEFIKELVQSATAAPTDELKYAELQAAQRAVEEQDSLRSASQQLLQMADSVDRVITAAQLVASRDAIAEIKSAFEEAISNDQQGEAWKYLAEKSGVLRSVKNENAGNIIENNIRRQVELENQLASERNKRVNFEADKVKAENEVYQLNLTLNAAKKKDQPTIQSIIDKKKEEIQLLEEEINAVLSKETQLTAEVNRLKDQLTVIQVATASKRSGNASRQVAIKQLSGTNSTNSSSLHTYVKQQIGELEKKNPSLKLGAVPSLTEQKEPNDTTNETARIKVESTDEPSVQRAIDPTYENDINEIASKSTLSTNEKQRALIERDQQLVDQVELSLIQVETELSSEPDNEQLIAKKSTLTAIKSAANERIQSRNASLTADSKEEVPQEVLQEDAKEVTAPISSTQLLISSYESDVQQVNSNASLSDEDRWKVLDQTDDVLRSALIERNKVIEQQLTEDPSNRTLKSEQTQIEEQFELLEANGSERAQLRAASRNKTDQLADQSKENVTDIAIKDENLQLDIEQKAAEIKQPETELTAEQIVAQIYPTYPSQKAQLLNSSMEERAKKAQLLALESDVLTKLEDQLRDIQRTETQRESNELLQKKAAVINSLIDDQRSTISTLNRAIDQLNQQEQTVYINELRSAESEQITSILAGNTGQDKAELTTQLELLEAYQNRLQVEEEKLATSNLSRQIEWVDQEVNQVEKAIKTMRITLGELEKVEQIEQNANVNVSNETVQEVTREAQIVEQLSTSELSKKERKALTIELNAIEEAKAEREVEVLEEQRLTTDASIKQLTSELNAVTSTDEAIKRNKALATITQDRLTEDIAQLQVQADKTKNQQEKKELLQIIVQKQEALKEELTSAYRQSKLLDIERKAEIGSLENEAELTARKRKYVIQVGELTKLVSYVDEEIANARGKEKIALQTTKTQLVNQLKFTDEAINEIDQRISNLRQPEPPVMDEKSLQQTVTVEEEVSMAQTQEYNQLVEKGKKLLELEKERSRLLASMDQQKAQLKAAVSTTSTSVAQLESMISEAQATRDQLNRVEKELVSVQGDFKQALPADQTKALVIQNMIQRGIEPIDQAQVALTLVPVPEMGLEITEKQVERAIPLGVKNPTGLVYRVQVGAFAKPIPSDLFKEFNPVSGEAIPNSNIMRYLAGFFNNSQRAITARDQIRKLGYADAFAVAYCDGKRISLAEARRLEQSGQCLPKGTNQLMLEVAMNTMEKIQLDDTTKRLRVNPLDYNKAKGAAPAVAIEASKGLFYTVQLGVFNRPIAANTVFQLEPLMTFRLPNGQIRYSVGQFNSIEEARPMQARAKGKGIQDAFITAYYNGQRITLQEAQALFSKEGTNVLESTMKKISVSADNASMKSNTATSELLVNRTVDAETISPVSTKEIQFVSKKTFSEYPIEELNRYNAKGFFYYDETDQRIKSTIVTSKEQLPPVYYFRSDLDTVILAKEEDSTHYFEIALEKIELKGDFSEWFIRYPGRKEIREVETGIEIRIFDKTEKQREDITSTLRLLELTYTEEWLVPVTEE